MQEKEENYYAEFNPDKTRQQNVPSSHRPNVPLSICQFCSKVEGVLLNYYIL